MFTKVALVSYSVTWTGLYASLVEEPVAFIPLDDPTDTREVAQVLDTANVVIGPWPTCAVPNYNVQLVQSTEAGVEQYDKNQFPETEFLCIVYEYEQAIAEYVFMALLSLRRDLMRCDKSLRIGNWGTGDPVPDIAGSTLGVEEFGRIGRALIVPCRSFKMNIISVTAQNSVGAPPEGVTFFGGPDSIGPILVESDVVVVAVPQTAQTIGLIGVREVSMIKRSAVLIDVGRGPVVDETALYDALSTNRLAGAAIDVWYRCPQTDELCIPSNLPFHNLPNVVMTPHQAGAYEQRYARRRAIIANNIDRISRREQPINVVWEPKAVLSNSRASFAKKEDSKNEGHKNTMDANRGS